MLLFCFYYLTVSSSNSPLSSFSFFLSRWYLHLNIALSPCLLSFHSHLPSPLLFSAIVEPEAQTNFSIFFLWIMTSSPKIVGEEKGCRPRLALTKLLFHIRFSLWTIFGCCGMTFGKTVLVDVGEAIMVWCCFKFLFLPKHCRGAWGGGRWSLPLCPALPLCLSPFSSLALVLLSFPWYFFLPMSLSLPLYLSFIFLLLACPAVWPPAILSVYFTLSSHSSLSSLPWFCWGRVEVISRYVTLAVCRQWMGHWQWLDSLGPQWQRQAREGNNYT